VAQFEMEHISYSVASTIYLRAELR